MGLPGIFLLRFQKACPALPHPCRAGGAGCRIPHCQEANPCPGLTAQPPVSPGPGQRSRAWEPMSTLLVGTELYSTPRQTAGFLYQRGKQSFRFRMHLVSQTILSEAATFCKWKVKAVYLFQNYAVCSSA